MRVYSSNIHTSVLPNYCFADGQRGGASSEYLIATNKDSGIRAVALELDCGYEAASQFIGLEKRCTRELIEKNGVPRWWMERFLEYVGYEKAPQPTLALSLPHLMSLLKPNHRVMLEVNDERFVPLIDHVLYDVEDWRKDIDQLVTGYWVFREAQHLLSGLLECRVVDGEGIAVDEIFETDVCIRDPLALAGYAFMTRKLDGAWEVDETGAFTLEATFRTRLPESRKLLTVCRQTLKCSPKYLQVFRDNDQSKPDQTKIPQQIAGRMQEDAERFLALCDFDYKHSDNDTLAINRRVGYQYATGEVYNARKRAFRRDRGFQTLMQELRFPSRR